MGVEGSYLNIIKAIYEKPRAIIILNSLKLIGYSKGSPEREVHRDTGLPKTDRNISNKQPCPTSARTGETKSTQKPWTRQPENFTKHLRKS